MKDLQNEMFWITRATKLCNLYELRVFMVWWTDHGKFSAGTALLHERLPHMNPANIRRALRGLVKKGFLICVAHKHNPQGRATPIYELNVLTLACETNTVQKQHNATH